MKILNKNLGFLNLSRRIQLTELALRLRPTENNIVSRFDGLFVSMTSTSVFCHREKKEWCCKKQQCRQWGEGWRRKIRFPCARARVKSVTRRKSNSRSWKSGRHEIFINCSRNIRINADRVLTMSVSTTHQQLLKRKKIRVAIETVF